MKTKLFYVFALIAIMVISVFSCTSDKEEDMRATTSELISNFEGFNNLNRYDKSTRVESDPGDYQAEWCTADVNGAIEGALFALELFEYGYIEPYELKLFMRLAARVFASARSIQVELEYNNPHVYYCNPSQSSDNDGSVKLELSDFGVDHLCALKEDIIILVKCQNVSSNEWMNMTLKPTDTKYASALEVAKYHNAILDVYLNQNFQRPNSIDWSSYSNIERKLFQNKNFETAFFDIVANPLYFSKYDSLSVNEPYYAVKTISRLFTTAILNAKNSEELNVIVDYYISQIYPSKELDEFEKEALLTMCLVGRYSYEYWNRFKESK